MPVELKDVKAFVDWEARPAVLLEDGKAYAIVSEDGKWTSAPVFCSSMAAGEDPIEIGFGRYDVVTFDCYGTPIDWDTGVSQQS